MYRFKLFYNLGCKTLQKNVDIQNCFSKRYLQHLSNAKIAKIDQKIETTSNSIFKKREIDENISEKEYLVQLKSDPDTFGPPVEPEITDPGDLKEFEHFEQQTLPQQKLRTSQYAKEIKKLIEKRKIKEALDFVEIKMIKEDKVKPENYIFNLLLGACGRVGYTKKAFSLYNHMKKRGLKITGGSYTALFNACANSPWSADGLKRAHHLRQIMIEKMYEPNDTNYNAMIKAFGRCGDLVTAFTLLDEMITKRMPITSDTLNFLFQACITDKEAGFRHALLIWKKMMTKRIKPNVYSFNLMLRIVRDCGLGDLEATQKAIKQVLKPSLKKHQLLEMESTKLLNDSNEIVVNNSSNENTALVIDKFRPNLMAKAPHLGNILSLSEITKAEDRLLLVGGLKGYLENMKDHGVMPDIKTFTQLLDCLPGNIASEKELLLAMKKNNIKPDLDFFNMLIKKRSMRFDYDCAKDVLELIKQNHYKPNLITYGVLALGCKTKGEALELLEEMKDHSYTINSQILGAMLKQACYHKNFPYVLEIMETSLKSSIRPNKKFLEHLENFKITCKKISNDKEHQLNSSISFQKGFKIFLLRYKTWLTEIEVDTSEEEHPWQQFRQNTETDIRNYKDKFIHFKPRRTSLFKVKTSHLLRNL